MRIVAYTGDYLKERGVIPLTGEACGIGLRVLCDLTEGGRDLLDKAFGGMVPTQGPWNEGVASVLLFKSMLLDLVAFGLLEEGYNSVLVHDPTAAIVALDDRADCEAFIKRGDSLAEYRILTKTGTAGGGLVNRHEFSGRVPSKF